MNIFNILVSIVSVLLVGLLIYVIVITVFRYECNEGNCEQKINGTYSSKKSCQTACQNPGDEEDDEDDGDDTLVESILIPPTYNCIKNKEGFFHCEEDEDGDGDYSSLEECQSNCYNQQVVSYPVYYPIRRPYYWGGYYRRPWRRRRHFRSPRTTRRSAGPRPFRR